MSLQKIVRDIEKEKNLEMNLAGYAGEMLSLYCRYSYTRLAYNYYLLSEILSDGNVLPEILAIVADIKDIIKTDVLGESVGAQSEKAVSRIHNIRNKIIADMKVVTSYADKLQINEYILNRIDTDNPDNVLPDDYSDEAFINELLTNLFSDKDNTVINAKIADMIGQLPIRITKQKYFEHISDAFSLYKGTDKSGVDSFVYMLRSLAALDEPEGYGQLYPDIHEIIDSFMNADFDKAGKDECKNFTDKLTYAAEYISNLSSLYLSLGEIVNDIYVILIAQPYAIMDVEEVLACKKILRAEEEDSDEVYDALEMLEGRQEHLYEIFSQYDYLIEDRDKYKNIIESTMQGRTFAALWLITRLVSTSTFIELDEEAEEGTATEEYINECRDALITELKTLFEGKTRKFVRSIMAATLGSLPAFVGNTDELKAYIRHSLTSCNDKTEKAASVKLIRELLAEYN